MLTLLRSAHPPETPAGRRRSFRFRASPRRASSSGSCASSLAAQTSRPPHPPQKPVTCPDPRAFGQGSASPLRGKRAEKPAWPQQRPSSVMVCCFTSKPAPQSRKKSSAAPCGHWHPRVPSVPLSLCLAEVFQLPLPLGLQALTCREAFCGPARPQTTHEPALSRAKTKARKDRLLLGKCSDLSARNQLC